MRKTIIVRYNYFIKRYVNVRFRKVLVVIIKVLVFLCTNFDIFFYTSLILREKELQE